MNKNIKQEAAGRIPLDANVEMVHLGKDGKPKPIFQENILAAWLLKKGWLNPLWINRWYAAVISPLFGYWALSKDGSNLITNTGKAAAASRINGSGGEAAFTSIGQGTGTTAAAAGDTALEAGKTASNGADGGVHALPAGSVTASRVTTTVANDTAQLVGTVAELATMAITESGVFNADTNGVMLARQVFSAVNVVSGDSLQFTWKIKAA